MPFTYKQNIPFKYSKQTVAPGHRRFPMTAPHCNKQHKHFSNVSRIYNNAVIYPVQTSICYPSPAQMNNIQYSQLITAPCTMNIAPVQNGGLLPPTYPPISNNTYTTNHPNFYLRDGHNKFEQQIYMRQSYNPQENLSIPTTFDSVQEFASPFPKNLAEWPYSYANPSHDFTHIPTSSFENELPTNTVDRGRVVVPKSQAYLMPMQYPPLLKSPNDVSKIQSTANYHLLRNYKDVLNQYTMAANINQQNSQILPVFSSQQKTGTCYEHNIHKSKRVTTNEAVNTVEHVEGSDMQSQLLPHAKVDEKAMQLASIGLKMSENVSLSQENGNARVESPSFLPNDINLEKPESLLAFERLENYKSDTEMVDINMETKVSLVPPGTANSACQNSCDQNKSFIDIDKLVCDSASGERSGRNDSLTECDKYNQAFKKAIPEVLDEKVKSRTIVEKENSNGIQTGDKKKRNLPSYLLHGKNKCMVGLRDLFSLKLQNKCNGGSSSEKGINLFLLSLE